MIDRRRKEHLTIGAGGRRLTHLTRRTPPLLVGTRWTADKRVEIVRTEFKLKLAELKPEHQAELTAVRSDFDKLRSYALRRNGTSLLVPPDEPVTWYLRATK